MGGGNARIAWVPPVSATIDSLQEMNRFHFSVICTPVNGGFD